MSSAFFTAPPSPAYQVPHDRIGLRWILVVHSAISRAFVLIREEGLALGALVENDVTIKLENVLNNRVLNRGEIKGFDRDFFGKVRRVEVVNHDGTKKSKKPDLCFDLQRENRIDWDQLQDALFAECKPVDKAHALGGHYCAVGKDCTGIERFVIGDYAWSMMEAMMIGYVRDGFRIDPHLVNALKDKTRRARLGHPSFPVIVEGPGVDSTAIPLYRTTHLRSFPWRNGKQAEPIDIFHSWHSCD